MTRSRSVVLAVVATVLVVAGVAVASSTEHRTGEPSRAELNRLQDRIDARWDELAREGVYVQSTGQPAEPCVAIGLANPTTPNIRYLERRFGPHICVAGKPQGNAYACAGAPGTAVPVGTVSVPDVRDLGLKEGSRRLLAHDLTFAISCSGQRERTIFRPARHSPEQLVRITRQCPRPGELVPAGTGVALEAKAVLPGGFAYEISALTPYHTGTETPCTDGRNAAPADRDRR